MSAALNGHTKVVKTLLQHGANGDMQTEVSTGNITSSAAGSGVSYIIYLCRSIHCLRGQPLLFFQILHQYPDFLYNI